MHYSGCLKVVVFLQLFSIVQFWRNLSAVLSCGGVRCSSNLSIFLLLYQHVIALLLFPKGYSLYWVLFWLEQLFCGICCVDFLVVLMELHYCSHNLEYLHHRLVIFTAAGFFLRWWVCLWSETGGFLYILHVGHDLGTCFTSLISSLLLDLKGPALVMSWSNFSSHGWSNWQWSFRASCFSDLVSVTVKVTCDDVGEFFCDDLFDFCYGYCVVSTACCYEWNFLSKGIGNIILKIKSHFGFLHRRFWQKDWYVVFSYISLDCDVVVTN